ncbi:metalloprotease [Corynebacterium sp. 13CS0277]|uniref:KPN_02809 family neutral zinc metallopeptidase n=1 Tax=Corynebacterium sp. 13CS0277 TaxID=2071994 RepID=UPI000D026A27|nr:neutral zinc metallopeptidase [Corynebacterium sp. 13CS0277]PRQ11965.1 metalloprotease [Corynebacterium sp. 13CS0277]
MTFRGDVERGAPRARRAGGGGGGRIAVGGGVGTLLLVGLFLLMGGNPNELGSLLGSDPGAQQQQLPSGEQSQTLDHCQTGEDANRYTDCRLEFTAKSLDEVWRKVLPAQADIAYTEPGLSIFSGQAQTGCGVASSQTGPFYCPTDQTAYFDTDFFTMLEQLGGKDSPLAQEYVVAHEFGHHIQQLEGTLGLSNYNQPGEDSNAVRIELQADCYAGLWAHYADKGQDAFLEPITQDQVRDAVTAARAVGDDNIQTRSGGRVRPDMFTHGSSEQRQQAFLAGYSTGQMSTCDTLERGGYRTS